MSILGCNHHPTPQPQLHPWLLYTHLVCHQWFHPLLLLPPTQFIRKNDVHAKEELNNLSNTVLLMAGMIDYKNGVVTDLRPPTWSDLFGNVLTSKKAESRARLFQMAWVSVLNHEKDSNYSMAGNFNPQRTYISMSLSSS